jgi:hypothetical protein
MRRVCALQAADRGARDILTMALMNATRLEERRERAYRDIVEVVRRAQAAGQLRADVVPEDVALLFMANAGVVRVMATAAPHAWERIVVLFLDGCRAPEPQTLPAPPTPAQVYRAMRRQVRPPSA